MIKDEVIFLKYDDAHNFIFNEIGDEGYTLLDYVACDKMNESINLIISLTNCSINNAKAIWVDLKNEYGDETTNPFIEKSTLPPAQQAHNNAVAQEWLNKPKCPTCGSRNIEKISLTKKAFGGAMFGLFSSDIRNTMHCKNCGYKW